VENLATRSANLSISWKAVAIGAVVLALAACVLAAIVATVKQADTLSVVALGVAVIAFIIQIIVFIVQAAAATEQSLRAQELYGSTIRLLATIEEKAEGTRQAVTTINDKMLAALIEKAIPEAASAGFATDSVRFGEEVAQRVSKMANQVIANPSPTVGASSVGEDSAPITLTFPDSNAVSRILPKLNEMAAYGGLTDLDRLGRDWMKYGRSGELSGLSMLAAAKPLYDQGFVRRVRRPWDKEPVFTLTPDGETAARMLLAKDVPDDAPPELLETRGRLQKAKEDASKTLQRLRNSDIPVEG